MIVDSVQNIVQPVLVELLLTLILGAVAWLMRRLPERMRIEIEAQHRAALHSALNTGVGWAIDALQLHPAVAPTDQAVTEVVEYVRRSVPDALRNLAPSQSMLEEMARAKLADYLTRGRGADPLTDALRDAGAPV